MRLRITDPLPYTPLTMKKISKLKSLPLPDQKVIFRLCTTHSYPEVCEIIAQPRTQPDGLAVDTNPSALCRFNQAYGWLAGDTQLLQQFADVLNVRPSREGFLEPVVRMVEQLAFRQLLDRKPINEILPALRILISLERLNFARLKWLDNHPLPELPAAEIDDDSPDVTEIAPSDPSNSPWQTPNPLSELPPAVNAHAATLKPAAQKPSSRSTPASPTSPALHATSAPQGTPATITPFPFSPTSDEEELDPETFQALLDMAAKDPTLTPAEKDRVAQELTKLAGNFTSCTKLHTAQPTTA